MTEEFLKENDGKIVWIRDDYLSMIGYSKCDKTTEILEGVIQLKAKMRAKGYIFKY